MSAFSIRRAVLGDERGILAAHHLSVRTIAAQDYTPRQIEAWSFREPTEETFFVLAAQITEEFVWVVEAKGSIFGYVHLRRPPELAPAGYLHALYLTPPAAGLGLAKHLLALCEHKARELALPALKLHSSKTALGFYHRCGYRREGPPLLHIVVGVGLECYPMTKDMAGENVR